MQNNDVCTARCGKMGTWPGHKEKCEIHDLVRSHAHYLKFQALSLFTNFRQMGRANFLLKLRITLSCNITLVVRTKLTEA